MTDKVYTHDNRQELCLARLNDLKFTYTNFADWLAELANDNEVDDDGDIDNDVTLKVSQLYTILNALAFLKNNQDIISMAMQAVPYDTSQLKRECIAAINANGNPAQNAVRKTIDFISARGLIATQIIEMILYCPKGNTQHVDEGKWAIKPHKTHQCQKCKHEWRHCNTPTVGVTGILLEAS